MLELLGQSKQQATQMVRRFNEHNREQIEQSWPHHKDEERLISMAKAGRQQLEELMAQERAMTLLPARDPRSREEPGVDGSD